MFSFVFACKEGPLHDYERIRAESMVRNNHILRSLGVGAAKAMMNKITPMSKVPNCEDSDPLYQPRADESHSEEISDQVCAYYL